MDRQCKKIYVKLKNNMGADIECQEFIFDNAKVLDYGDGYLVLEDATDHLLFKCRMDDVDRFAVVG